MSKRDFDWFPTKAERSIFTPCNASASIAIAIAANVGVKPVPHPPSAIHNSCHSYKGSFPCSNLSIINSSILQFCNHSIIRSNHPMADSTNVVQTGNPLSSRAPPVLDPPKDDPISLARLAESDGTVPLPSSVAPPLVERHSKQRKVYRVLRDLMRR